MNCPCSGVYVCAYIVIFLPWPAGQKKIWVSLWFLFFVSSLLRFSSLLKGKSTVTISYAAEETSTQTTVCFLFVPISYQFTFGFKISLNNRTCDIKIGQQKETSPTGDWLQNILKKSFLKMNVSAQGTGEKRS